MIALALLALRALAVLDRRRVRRQIAATHGPCLPLELRTPPGGWSAPVAGEQTPEAAAVEAWLGRTRGEAR